MPAVPLFFNSVAHEGVEGGAVYIKSNNGETRMLIDFVGGRTTALGNDGAAGLAVGILGGVSEADEAKKTADTAVADVRQYLKDKQIDISALIKRGLTEELSNGYKL